MKKHLILGLAALSTTLVHAEEESAPAFSDREAMREKAKQEVAKILDESDANGDGNYSSEELVVALTELRKHREAMREKMRERAIEAGREPRNRQPRQDREPPSAEKVAERMMSKLDDDGDGLLSREQVETAVERVAGGGRGNQRRRAGGPGQ